MTSKQRKLLRNYALGILGAVSVSLYVGGINWENQRPESITIDGQTIDFTWTDSHKNEDLLIFTDQRDYTNGLSHATVYAAVVNRSGQAQNVELMGYFKDDRRRIRDVSILTEATYDVPVFEQQCTTVDVAVTEKPNGHSTRASAVEQCEEVQVGTTQETRLEWVPLPTEARDVEDALEESQILARRGIPRKAVENYVAQNKTIGFPVQRNGTLYYKLEVAYPPNDRGDFQLEVIGSAGGYGHLQ